MLIVFLQKEQFEIFLQLSSAFFCIPIEFFFLQMPHPAFMELLNRFLPNSAWQINALWIQSKYRRLSISHDL